MAKRLTKPEFEKGKAVIQRSMMDAAENIPLPERFTAYRVSGKPKMRITDEVSGKRMTVGLCDYRAVRVALAWMEECNKPT